MFAMFCLCSAEGTIREPRHQPIVRQAGDLVTFMTNRNPEPLAYLYIDHVKLIMLQLSLKSEFTSLRCISESTHLVKVSA